MNSSVVPLANLMVRLVKLYVFVKHVVKWQVFPLKSVSDSSNNL